MRGPIRRVALRLIVDRPVLTGEEEAPAFSDRGPFLVAPERCQGTAGLPRNGQASGTTAVRALARDRRSTAAGKSSTDADRSCRHGSQQRRSEEAQTQARVPRHVACPPEAPSRRER